MSNHQAVEDKLTELIEHVTEAMDEIRRLSPEWKWHYVFAAAQEADDPAAPDARITCTPTETSEVKAQAQAHAQELFMFSNMLRDQAQLMATDHVKVRGDDA